MSLRQPEQGQELGRDKCVEAYREYLEGNSVLMAQLQELKGKILGCWCAPKNYHRLENKIGFIGF